MEVRRFELRLLGPSGQDLLGAGPDGPVQRIGGEFTTGGDEEQIALIALNPEWAAPPTR